jgi:Protein NO VEIN, C-terminal
MTLPLKPKSSQTLTPEELAERLAATFQTGKLGERMVDRYLSGQATGATPVHTWVSAKFAEHPYDFELLSASGAVEAVIDAKATSSPWPGEFFMSIAEVNFARSSPVPYRIYRLSEVGMAGAELRVSGDIRPFAEAALNTLLPHLLSGTRITTMAVRPTDCGINWSAPIRLPPLPP